jgi:hypothetical protein
MRKYTRPCEWICLAASLTFWIPSIVLHVRAGKSGITDAGSLGLGCTVCAVTVFTILWRVTDGSLAAKAIPFIVGIWFWGPPCMTLGWWLGGSRPHTMGDLVVLLPLWACFPIFTPVMATYDGTLLALCGTTALFVMIVAAGWTRDTIARGMRGRGSGHATRKRG